MARRRRCGGRRRATGTAAIAALRRRHDEHGAWAHAYLHRVEGDEHNAAGWYRRAGKTPSTAALTAEWEEIARAVLV